MRWYKHLVKAGCVVGLWAGLTGCRTKVSSEQTLPKLSQAELLRKPVLELFPQHQHFRERVLRVDLGVAQRVQVVWGQGKSQRIYSLVRQEKAWWALRLLGENEMEAKPVAGKEIESLLGAFYGLRPARCSGMQASPTPTSSKKKSKKSKKKSKREKEIEALKKAEMDRCMGFSGFDPERAKMQISFFGPNDRFLLRAMKTPREQVCGAS
ncbi:MAG: hypothetical protein H6727_21050 [Myxococcales bacterium]|nr:hypothetical protein [Myxococcales bacterium]